MFDGIEYRSRSCLFVWDQSHTFFMGNAIAVVVAVGADYLAHVM